MPSSFQEATRYRRHLNDLEFCYRMLIDHYAFASEDIAVLYFHGARTVGVGPRPDCYPDEGTDDPYRIKIDGRVSAPTSRKRLPR